MTPWRSSLIGKNVVIEKDVWNRNQWSTKVMYVLHMMIRKTAVISSWKCDNKSEQCGCSLLLPCQLKFRTTLNDILLKFGTYTIYVYWKPFEKRPNFSWVIASSFVRDSGHGRIKCQRSKIELMEGKKEYEKSKHPSKLLFFHLFNILSFHFIICRVEKGNFSHFLI